MWGLVFVAPLLLPQYPAVLLSCARYLAFGLIALPLAWLDRRRIVQLTGSDWIEALKLSAIGNLLYYLCLSAAIQHAGGPMPTMIIGTLPVLIAVVSNRRDAQRDGRLPWLRLLSSLILIAAGIGCVNHAELSLLMQDPAHDLKRYATGAVLALGALLCWTWYPIRNADWLRHHADRSPSTWATAQGIATLPLAALGCAGFWVHSAWSGGMDFAMPFGPTPLRFVALMVAIGLLASWLGTLCWNEASQRLPTSLVGQLIVFETLSALAYAFVLRGQAPAPLTALGIALLVAGVVWALRVRPPPAAASAG
jgi:drug/metabolite transporter (DMT)-like permease